jgi:hypothetical protein
MTRALLAVLTGVALLTAGCATTLARLNSGVPDDGAAAPSTEATDSQGPTNFGSATPPHFGPQYP